MDEFDSTRQLLRKFKAPAPPAGYQEDFLTRLNTKIDAETSDRKIVPFSLRPRLLASAAGFVALGCASILLFKSNPELTPSSVETPSEALPNEALAQQPAKIHHAPSVEQEVPQTTPLDEALKEKPQTISDPIPPGIVIPEDK